MGYRRLKGQEVKAEHVGLQTQTIQPEDPNYNHEKPRTVETQLVRNLEVENANPDKTPAIAGYLHFLGDATRLRKMLRARVYEGERDGTSLVAPRPRGWENEEETGGSRTEEDGVGPLTSPASTGAGREVALTKGNGRTRKEDVGPVQ
jgi:hypothetical protein